jgi:TatA/E family protein of Tat protein translocase
VLGSIGLPELLFIMMVALLIFGPKRLPEIGRTVGRALGEFRRASSELKRSLETEMRVEEETPRTPFRPAPPALAPAEPPPVPPAQEPPAPAAAPPAPPTEPE